MEIFSENTINEIIDVLSKIEEHFNVKLSLKYFSNIEDFGFIDEYDTDFSDEKIKNMLTQIKEKEEEGDKEVSISLGVIRAVCGWDKFCDVTGYSPYCVRGHSISNTDTFYVKIKHARELGLWE